MLTTLLVDLPLWLTFCAALLFCWGLTLFGMPGNWLIVALSAAVAWLAPDDSRFAMGWANLAVLLALALAGEVVEFAAGSAAATRAGGSRRGALGALAGAFVGAIAGAVVGLPVPVIGSAMAAVLGGATGATVGAMLGELHLGRSLDASWRVGHAAFWGRLLGTLSKATLGIVMVVVAAIAASS
ncbi:MAG TPA: DUF456 family protein [Pirellulales bacterium]|jgi:hypothetical protein